MDVHPFKCGINMYKRELRRYLYLQGEIQLEIASSGPLNKQFFKRKA
jgi:hypothetical protein